MARSAISIALERARELRLAPKPRRFAPAPYATLVVTEHHKFAQVDCMTICAGDERQSSGSHVLRQQGGATVDLGNSEAIGFKGLYHIEDSTKRVHEPANPVVVDYDTRYIDGIPYYWNARDRTWCRRLPRKGHY